MLPLLFSSRRRLVFDSADAEHASENGNCDCALTGIEAALSPRELRRVGKEFNAMDLDLTEQVCQLMCNSNHGMFYDRDPSRLRSSGLFF